MISAATERSTAKVRATLRDNLPEAIGRCFFFGWDVSADRSQVSFQI